MRQEITMSLDDQVEEIEVYIYIYIYIILL